MTEEPSLDLVLDRLLNYVSRYNGPLLRVGEWSALNSRSFLHCFTADLCKMYGTNHDVIGNPAGGGQSLDRTQALVSTLAEAMERYSGCILPDESLLRRATYTEIRRSVAHVAELEDYQFLRASLLRAESGLKRLPADEQLLWMRGVDLTDVSAKDIWCPLALISILSSVSYPYCRGHSNGYALGTTRESAQMGAILELLERDALMWTWWTKMSPPHFRLEDIEPLIAFRLARDLAPLRDRIWILDLSGRWGLPTFCLYIEGNLEMNQPAVYWSTSCHVDPIRALVSCLTEGVRIFFMHSTGAEHDRNSGPESDFDFSIMGIPDIKRLSHMSESRRQSQFMLDGRRADWGEIERLAQGRDDQSSPLSWTLDKLRSQDARAFLFDMTAPELRQNEFEVWRAVIPEAIPLNLTHDTRAFGSRPLRDIPVSSLNAYPHLFY